jgi:hypothetical protein
LIAVSGCDCVTHKNRAHKFSVFCFAFPHTHTYTHTHKQHIETETPNCGTAGSVQFIFHMFVFVFFCFGCKCLCSKIAIMFLCYVLFFFASFLQQKKARKCGILDTSPPHIDSQVTVSSSLLQSACLFFGCLHGKQTNLAPSFFSLVFSFFSSFFLCVCVCVCVCVCLFSLSVCPGRALKTKNTTHQSTHYLPCPFFLLCCKRYIVLQLQLCAQPACAVHCSHAFCFSCCT